HATSPTTPYGQPISIPRGGVGQRARRRHAADLSSREEFTRSLARAAFITARLALGAMSSEPAARAQHASRLRGQIAKAARAMLTLKARDGGTLNVKLADDARVAALNKATLADIKQDTFIGIAGMPEADGTIKAFSIHIFLPAQRGVVADRHGPW